MVVRAEVGVGGGKKSGSRGEGSQGHCGAGVFELAGQHASVELVELHQVDQVAELGGAVVKAEEDLAVLLTLNDNTREGGEDTFDHQVTTHMSTLVKYQRRM